ncbi:hypothetical protein M703_00435 [Neisseria gonorrhoeae SK29344]|uniref:Uncharacterized protein n=2 Tax=Neisseria gonorrhoeae TaxID=485 RepID=A0AA44U9T6_NEIGO|nr:Hypothetical protein NGK_1303 [Neisseria gonorrhoeae NCCP11945]APW53414.1 hypothetical protein T556_05950 [Neisseria gonorrhoeae NG-k51.05]EFE04045.1 conserved hypothetical protein [Neisseria gonorrhoeae DGI2]KLR76887.1 hypothetical protein M717_05755 [Neisseria gonorrhoeae SK33414]KLR80272.1 hypothetical protein M679_01575 [Neisseria gonorrhoeae SK7842]KLR80501.1 hypothetical protein M680_08750 [Neisseria gonorrhoeae SK8976]KLR82718.1 hypothetical protein M684_03330 [Neisseria gonorrhoeae
MSAAAWQKSYFAKFNNSQGRKTGSFPFSSENPYFIAL